MKEFRTKGNRISSLVLRTFFNIKKKEQSNRHKNIFVMQNQLRIDFSSLLLPTHEDQIEVVR